jgi:peptidoglycan/LPS O-acetylase OafA/YrhL
VALFFTALVGCIALSPRQAVMNRVLSNPVFVRIGRYSYAMYLFHAPLIELLAPRFRQWTGVPGMDQRLLPAILFTGLTLIVTYAAAWLSWHLLEKHFLKLKAYFPSTGFAVPSALRPGKPDVKDNAQEETVNIKYTPLQPRSVGNP